jgi:hypothetical protein
MLRPHFRLRALLRPAAIPLALVLASACDRDAKDSREAGERARATAVAAPAAASGPDSTAGEVATIRGLTPGDRACYVDLDGGGQQEAAFDVCERAELVGKRVRLERRRTWVLATSCEGDPECARRDTVDLIVSARVLPEDGSQAPGPR